MSWGVRYAKMHPNGRWVAGPMSSDLSLYGLSQSNATATKAFDQEGQIALWDLEQRKIIRVFSGFKNWSLGLEFDREGELLAAASVDGSVAIWEVNTVTWYRFSMDTIRSPIRHTRSSRYVSQMIAESYSSVLVMDR